jgi:hypothetical protein
MFLFLHKIPANFIVVATAVFVALLSEPSASAQEQWGFAGGTIVSSDEHKLSVRPDNPSQMCAACAVLKKGDSIEFLTDYKAACPALPSTYCPAAPQGLSFEEQCAKDWADCHRSLVYPASMMCEVLHVKKGCKTD